MRTPKNLPAGTPINSAAKFTDGTVLNETVSNNGTPVVEELYGDVLTNIYKIIRSVGLVPNGSQDSEETSYQLLAALQKFTNTQNDIERVVSLVGSVFSVDIDFTYLPNKYLMIGKVVGNYGAGPYTIKGTKATPTYTFTSPTGFSTGDDVLLVLNQSGVVGLKFAAALDPALITKGAGDITGSDPFYSIDLSANSIPAYPKYFNVYIDKAGDGTDIEMQDPVQYSPSAKLLKGMNSPTDYPNQIIKIRVG